jgi:hypothetical protein
MAEHLSVEQDVAGSTPVSHPFLFPELPKNAHSFDIIITSLIQYNMVFNEEKIEKENRNRRIKNIKKS